MGCRASVVCLFHVRSKSLCPWQSSHDLHPSSLVVLHSVHDDLETQPAVTRQPKGDRVRSTSLRLSNRRFCARPSHRCFHPDHASPKLEEMLPRVFGRPRTA